MKQKNIFTAIILTILFIPSVFTISLSQESRTFQLKDYNKVYLEGAFRVYLIQGNSPGLEIKASDSEAIDYVEVDNNEASLRLKITKKHFDFNRITLYITFKDLEKMVIHGGVRLKTNGSVKLNDFFLQVEGGASISMDMDARTVKVIGQGGVLFDMAGNTESIDLKLEGAGHVDAGELKSEVVNFSIEGVGTGRVYATRELNASLKGVGKVVYRGNPVVNKSIDGLGSVVED